jgi:hypothetical protein
VFGTGYGDSELALHITLRGKLADSVRARKITPRESDALYVEAMRLYHLKPVVFTGTRREQLSQQHLRYLQKAIISHIARREIINAGGGPPGLLEKIIADVDSDLGLPPEYDKFDVEQIAKAAEPKVIDAVQAATQPKPAPPQPGAATPEDRGGSKTPGSVYRVYEHGKPQFQLRSGEEGISVFDAEVLRPEQILPAFRAGSAITARQKQAITALGLVLVKTPGAAFLPTALQENHWEIQRGPAMTRNQFKKSLKLLDDSPGGAQ